MYGRGETTRATNQRGSRDERQPRSAMFNFERYVPNPYGPTQTIAIHQAVLIPNGKESDLVRLQSELTARYPKARISLA